MDILKMANDIVNNMSNEDRDSIENMDMEKMISHVTKNVFSMMNNGGSNEMNNRGSNEMNTTSPVIQKPKFEEIKKTPDICFDLNVNLEDFYVGKKKKINVKRKIVRELNGEHIMSEEKKKFEIPIERGMKDEQKIIFKGEADQVPGYAAGDIIITLIANEHPLFTRKHDDLYIVKDINISQIYDYSCNVKHLDERILKIVKLPTDSLHSHNSLRMIKGQGMPVYKSKNNFGNLFITFNLIIPKLLTIDKISTLKTIFNNNTPEVLNSHDEYTLQIPDTTSGSESENSEFDSDSDSGSNSDIELSDISVSESES